MPRVSDMVDRFGGNIDARPQMNMTVRNLVAHYNDSVAKDAKRSSDNPNFGARSISTGSNASAGAGASGAGVPGRGHPRIREVPEAADTLRASPGDASDVPRADPRASVPANQNRAFYEDKSAYEYEGENNDGPTVRAGFEDRRRVFSQKARTGGAPAPDANHIPATRGGLHGEVGNTSGKEANTAKPHLGGVTDPGEAQDTQNGYSHYDGGAPVQDYDSEYRDVNTGYRDYHQTQGYTADHDEFDASGLTRNDDFLDGDDGNIYENESMLDAESVYAYDDEALAVPGLSFYDPSTRREDPGGDEARASQDGYVDDYSGQSGDGFEPSSAASANYGAGHDGASQSRYRESSNGQQGVGASNANHRPYYDDDDVDNYDSQGPATSPSQLQYVGNGDQHRYFDNGDREPFYDKDDVDGHYDDYDDYGDYADDGPATHLGLVAPGERVGDHHSAPYGVDRDVSGRGRSYRYGEDGDPDLHDDYASNEDVAGADAAHSNSQATGQRGDKKSKRPFLRTDDPEARAQRQAEREDLAQRRTTMVSDAVDRISIAADPFVDFITNNPVSTVPRPKGRFSRFMRKLLGKGRKEPKHIKA